MPRQCAWAHAMVVPMYPLLFLQCLLSTHTVWVFFLAVGQKVLFLFHFLMKESFKKCNETAAMHFCMASNERLFMNFTFCGMHGQGNIQCYCSSLLYTISLRVTAWVELMSLNSSTCFKWLLFSSVLPLVCSEVVQTMAQ